MLKFNNKYHCADCNIDFTLDNYVEGCTRECPECQRAIRAITEPDGDKRCMANAAVMEAYSMETLDRMVENLSFVYSISDIRESIKRLECQRKECWEQNMRRT